MKRLNEDQDGNSEIGVQSWNVSTFYDSYIRLHVLAIYSAFLWQSITKHWHVSNVLNKVLRSCFTIINIFYAGKKTILKKAKSYLSTMSESLKGEDFNELKQTHIFRYLSGTKYMEVAFRLLPLVSVNSIAAKNELS